MNKPWMGCKGFRNVKLGLLLALGLLFVSSGCERYKGAGFPQWNQSLGGMRGASKDAKPSGFFTDRRSEQIEQNLGGDF